MNSVCVHDMVMAETHKQDDRRLRKEKKDSLRYNEAKRDQVEVWKRSEERKTFCKNDLWWFHSWLRYSYRLEFIPWLGHNSK